MNRSLTYLILLLAAFGTYAYEGYSFQQGTDSPGNDIQHYPGVPVEEVKALCDIDPTCAAFNTLGWLKRGVVPSAQYVALNNARELSEGLYVKIPMVSGYTFTQGVDIFGNDIGPQTPGLAAADLKISCDADPTCLGFTTYGYLKNIIPSAEQWYFRSNDPLDGVYIKVNVDVRGYTFASGRDTLGFDIKMIPGASIDALEVACNADTNCVGFNTLGWLKNKVEPIAKWVSLPSTGPQGLFVKIPSLDGYNFIQGTDIWGSDIKKMDGASVAELKAACDADSTCFAFTTYGYLKNLVPSVSEWHHTDLDPQGGIYLKNIKDAEGHPHDQPKNQEEKVKLPKGTCWLESFGRGAGVPISSCPDGFEKNGALCYPRCNDGFYGVGPVCWSHCPGNYRDDGAFCAKPGSYGRGSGYALWNEGKCNRENAQGCEKWGAMYYPRCAAFFHNAACCICSPDCPGGMTDIGVSCAKHSYGRGAGSVLTCAPGQDQSGGLCYPYCKEGYKGIGPVCWNSCPAGFDACGALCVPSGQCAGKILKISSSTIKGMTQIGVAAAAASAGDPSSIVDGVEGVDTVLQGFNYPICGQTAGVLDPATQVTGTLNKVGQFVTTGQLDLGGDDEKEESDTTNDLKDTLGNVADIVKVFA